MERERINWPLVTAVTVAGLAALGAGLWLGKGTADAWSSVLIELGAAIGLASVLVFLERRVVRRVATSTARAEAERVTADLRDRIEHLEDVDAAQEQERSEQRRQAAARMESIRQGGITSAAVGALLVEAVRDRLIDPDMFHVRTSSDPACPVLYMLSFVDPKRVLTIYIDFEPIEIDAQPILVKGHPIPVPLKTDSTAMWTDQEPSVIAAELQAGLERRNEPARGFGFGHSLERLLKSIQVMRDARAAEAESPARLEGLLRVLINDDWAYTSAGLEAVAMETRFTVKAGGWPDGGGRWVGPYLRLSQEVRSHADTSLAEALEWIEKRELIRLLEPGADPVKSLFSRQHGTPYGEIER
ncbi:MAG: hypothetical protein P1T08_17415 [Acidimicrobiia bacterium]|nr:hypothetical protein [Acidimicrobiia bacterium]